VYPWFSFKIARGKKTDFFLFNCSSLFETLQANDNRVGVKTQRNSTTSVRRCEASAD
jgi:hypothetical protein